MFKSDDDDTNFIDGENVSFYGHTEGNPPSCQHSSKAFFVPVMILCSLCFIYGRKHLVFPHFSEWKLRHREFKYLVQVYT